MLNSAQPIIYGGIMESISRNFIGPENIYYGMVDILYPPLVMFLKKLWQIILKIKDNTLETSKRLG